MCRGVNSAPLSMATTYQQAQCATSLQSFWICTRGTTLSEYTQEFNLAQYRGYHVDTDVKKADLFRKGLTIQL
jgi:hypothetical protein